MRTKNIIHQPNGLVHMDILTIKDIIDYSLYIYNDKKEIEYEYKPDGCHIKYEYHPNGKLKSRGNYRDNELYGLYEEWDLNGELTRKIIYSYDIDLSNFSLTTYVSVPIEMSKKMLL
jgi:antitoxin component YwqK of YwqJK toxin-antitoxin module